MPDEQVNQAKQANQDALACQEVVEMVTDYLENALLPRTRALLETHLTECDGCSTYFEQVQQTITLLREVAQQPINAETKETLLEAFRLWRTVP